jgi:hypothetical protein
MTIPDVEDADQLVQRLRQFASNLVDVFEDANVSEPEVDDYVEDGQFMKTIEILMRQNDLRFVTYIVERDNNG